MLTSEDKQKVINTYSGTLHQYGSHNSMGVHWSAYSTQQLRFQILSQIGDLNGKSVLDVGCGVGDFYGYLNRKNLNFEYLGIDITPEMIIEAKKKYPDGSFELAEVSDIDTKFDYVFGSGVFTHRIDDYQKKYFDMIREMFEKSNLGIGFNMLRKGEHLEDDIFVTYSPTDVVTYCKTFSDNVKLIDNYLYYDFSVFVMK